VWTNPTQVVGYTCQGNTFNGASQLVQLNSSGNFTAINASNLTNLNSSNMLVGSVTTNNASIISTDSANTAFSKLQSQITASIGTGVTSITGTSNQVIASASTGAVTLSLPQNIDVTASPRFSSVQLNNGSYAVTLNAGTLTNNRIVTFPDAATNTIQPTTLLASNWVQYIDSFGTQHLNQPAFTNISGTIANTQLPGGGVNGATQLVELNSSGALPAVSGVNLTNLNGSSITSGTVSAAYLPQASASASGVVTLDGTSIVSNAGIISTEDVLITGQNLNAYYYPTFVTLGSYGYQTLFADSTSVFQYNPSTGTLRSTVIDATTFSGNVGTSGTVTDPTTSAPNTLNTALSNLYTAISGAGVETVGIIDSQTASSNGAQIFGSDIFFQSASALNPGMINTGTQTFAGAKTFTSAITANLTGSVTGNVGTSGTAYDPTTSTPGVTLNTVLSNIYTTASGGIDTAGNFSPVFTTSVTSGNLSFTPVSQNANTFYAGPNGSSGNAVFRTIVAADLPSSQVNTTWTPTDGSGSGLSFTINYATYSQISNMIRFTTSITYPATADGAYAIISGLPVGAFNVELAQGISNSPSKILMSVMVTGTTLVLCDAKGLPVPNSDLSNATIIISGSYCS
jgi:hypothetical protein